jgi:hypothetical protein
MVKGLGLGSGLLKVNGAEWDMTLFRDPAHAGTQNFSVPNKIIYDLPYEKQI